ncbi:MAG: RNA-guided endonuclease TnpB family protein [Candidatus Hydrothermarchaeales archaeon]
MADYFSSALGKAIYALQDQYLLGLGMRVVKSITLNLLGPTRIKQEKLIELEQRYKEALSYVVAQGVKAKRTRLQGMFYGDVRGFGLHSQIANDLFKDAVAILNNGGKVKKVCIPYNIPRSANFGVTDHGNPVVVVATLDGRMAMPIAMDGAYKRYGDLLEQGYETTFFRLNHSKIHVTLKKEFPAREDYDAVLGVDIGVKRLATISVVSNKGRIKRQLYLGQDVWNKQRDICIRRSKLRGHADKGSRYARQALRRLRRYENDYTTTRCWQVAHEIVKLAERYNAFIAIEDLKHLKNARGNRRGNRKAKRMPYYKLRSAIESIAGQAGRLVVAVYPRGTSHICSRCGAMGNRNRAIFKCPECGNIVNSDRNASVNIAIRAGTIAQIPDGNLAVNPGVRVHDGIGIECLQHAYHSSTHAPTSVVGS